MKSKILCGFCVSVITLMLAIPVYAYSGTANGGNGGLGNGMGTSTHGTNMHAQSNDGMTRTQATGNHEVSVYGTGTGSQFLNVNANRPGTMNGSPMYRTRNYANDGYRATAVTTTKNTSWGWLGLFGLLGLFGIRNRNPERKS